ncbi:hypothetical protein [Rossellomorea aquimaris]|uniref:hypothetical protein n=1 Tax=Rossellomorea aquimaris TaxID=189382 RepID=UPI000A618E4F|nr:hypothetical protein [Rossellomorea aquimaris]
MNELMVQIILVAGMIYGFTSFLLVIRKKEKREKNQLIMPIALIVTCGATFLMTIT